MPSCPAAGCSARTPASRSPHSAVSPGCARRAGRVDGSGGGAPRRLARAGIARARYVCNSSRSAREERSMSAWGSSRAGSPSHPPAARASATTRSSSPSRSSARSPSSATRGSGSTRTARGRRGRSKTARPALGEPGRLAVLDVVLRQPPVHLGAEDDHVRERRRARSAAAPGCRGRGARGSRRRRAGRTWQDLECRLQQHRREHGAGEDVAEAEPDVREARSRRRGGTGRSRRSRRTSERPYATHSFETKPGAKSRRSASRRPTTRPAKRTTSDATSRTSASALPRRKGRLGRP